MVFQRFTRIRREFGTKEFVRTIILLIVLAGMIFMDVVGFRRPWAAIVVGTGLLIGWLLRGMIVEWGESLFWVLPAGIIVYGIILFIGERILGLSREVRLLIITLTTVFIFNLQFWTLSDTSFVSTEREIDQ